MSDKALGKIITFYSYKGGTGRSMALANVAWLLASSGKKVLVVDWDLEAPGLHRYFSPFLLDKEMTASDGLINFVDAYATEAIKPLPAGETIPEDWYRSFADLNRYALTLNWKFPYGGGLDFIPAGRQAPSYSTLVNFFDWKNLYERLGGWQFFETAKEQLREKYDYILLDSRTGVSDTSGICTVQMPDALVVCFTYNNQSIRGASAIVHNIYERRVKVRQVTSEPSTKPHFPGKFRIFPLPTRVEQAEQDKLGARRSYAWSMFDQFLDLPDLDERRIYWNEVEVPYIPFFAFEEILAPFKEETHDPRSFIASLMRLTKRLALEISDESLTLSPTLLAPEERQRILQEFAHTPEVLSAESAPANVVETESEAQVRRAETLFMHSEPSEQAKSQRIFTRLVRVVSREEGGEHGRRSVEFDELGLPSDDSLVRKLVEAQLLNLKTRRNSNLVKVELASEGLIRNWGRLRNWIESDLDFLVWRQRLGETARDWDKRGRKSDFVYSGELLHAARVRMAERKNDLNDLELSFIKAIISSESRALRDSQQHRMRGDGRVFIIRPFGEKLDRKGLKINFDKVERNLITPALKALDIQGGMTGDIMRAGNLREDMLQLLLTADLVIADVSVDNANVFYELGVRQALRDKRTLLLRCESDEIPFDLLTERYLTYDRDNPQASLEALIRLLTETISGDEQDSPVFKLLPKLKAPDPSLFLAVPMDFNEEVEKALAGRSPGDLELLAQETNGFGWRMEGLRLIGQAQFNLRAFAGARRSWEGVRDFDPGDLEANQKLATIYQRLGDLSKSDGAIERALSRKGLSSVDRAEVRSLRGSNEKARWRDEWEITPPEQQRSQALRSVFLSKALNEYVAAFEEDLNHYYSGINALAMCVIQAKLAEALPDVWAEGFETDLDAQRELDALQKKIESLTSGVELSLQAARKRNRDFWAELSEATRVLLTSTRPARVASSYRQALAGAEPFYAEAEQRQLQLYERLGILSENVKSALELFPPASPLRELKKQHILLFAGHMLDQPGRVPPRFPPEKEEIARQAIRDAILAEQEATGGITYGIASGAHGGDILFHEVCAELGIKTELWLALPPEKYVSVGVQNYVGIGTDKLFERFRMLQRQLTPRWMADDLELPRWLRAKPGYDFWQRFTLWMVYNAFRIGAENLTLIALWDGDEACGTGDFVRRVMERGGKIVPIPTKQLFNL
jgi:conflict system STAND superfamily ATPase/tetratricopeptide repeat protein/AAA domain-containing protein